MNTTQSFHIKGGFLTGARDPRPLLCSERGRRLSISLFRQIAIDAMHLIHPKSREWDAGAKTVASGMVGARTESVPGFVLALGSRVRHKATQGLIAATTEIAAIGPSTWGS